jgi:hypothetical protein
MKKATQRQGDQMILGTKAPKMLPNPFFVKLKTQFCTVEKVGQEFFFGQQPHVPFLLLDPPFFPIILFGSTTLLTRMTGTSLHMQLPLTSQSHRPRILAVSVIFQKSNQESKIRPIWWPPCPKTMQAAISIIFRKHFLKNFLNLQKNKSLRKTGMHAANRMFYLLCASLQGNHFLFAGAFAH